MKHTIKPMMFILLGALLGFATPYAVNALTDTPVTAGQRFLEMKVNVAGNDMLIWKTVIAPQQKNSPGIAMHRHEFARILIPLTEGVLQRRDATGETTNYLLKIGKPIFLPEDTVTGLHTDENIGAIPIEVIVLQFTQSPVNIEPLIEADLKKVMVFQ